MGLVLKDGGSEDSEEEVSVLLVVVSVEEVVVVSLEVLELSSLEEDMLIADLSPEFLIFLRRDFGRG